MNFVWILISNLAVGFKGHGHVFNCALFVIIRIPCSNNSILNVDEPKYSMGLIFLFIISIQRLLNLNYVFFILQLISVLKAMNILLMFMLYKSFKEAQCFPWSTHKIGWFSRSLVWAWCSCVCCIASDHVKLNYC